MTTALNTYAFNMHMNPVSYNWCFDCRKLRQIWIINWFLTAFCRQACRPSLLKLTWELLKLWLNHKNHLTSPYIIRSSVLAKVRLCAEQKRIILTKNKTTFKCNHFRFWPGQHALSKLDVLFPVLSWLLENRRKGRKKQTEIVTDTTQKILSNWIPHSGMQLEGSSLWAANDPQLLIPSVVTTE